MDNMTLKINFFGSFRRIGNDISFPVPRNSSVNTIKAALVEKIGQQYRILVEESVLADKDKILSENQILEEGTTLSILPPVCGG
jgi:molybdopterin converting factor small subunit